MQSPQKKYAVIGLGCRFPGSSNSPQEFFQNLYDSRNCVSTVPTDRWNSKYYTDKDKNKPGRVITNRGGFMDKLFEFDPEAFQMSVKEASNIDPQQKILLETTLQALEDANIRYRGSNAGVFIGTGQVDYTKFVTSNPYYVNEYTATGSALSIHSNRLSYCFDLRGPSISIDTACSSSGTAMHLALDSMEKGHCEYAIVGGINMLLNHNMSIGFSKLSVLSPDGICRSFDAKANGYVRSEGCGIVIIKPLEKALEEGNHIYCVVRATSANQDGAQSPSLTMPSTEGQSKVIQAALQRSGVSPSDIMYAEAHATGTVVGDPIEINTIGSMVGKHRNSGEKLRIGSVKSNIGHCECSSYMASLIKVALMIDKRTLLPSINYSEPNPKIKFEEYNLQVQTAVEPFDPTGRAFLISSFGFGGANVCTILEAPPQQKENKEEEEWRLQTKRQVFLLSARSKEALQQRITQFQQLDPALYNNDQFTIANTMNNAPHETNRYLSVGFGENVTLQTVKFSEAQRIADGKRPLVFVFSGQGPQHIKMGRQLYALYPIFRKTIERCDELYKAKAGFSLINDIGIFGPTAAKDPKIIDNIQYTLPSLVFIQIALFELWSSFGLKPDCVMGHSFGEMCALYASKSFPLELIIESTAARAGLMRQLDNQGTMIALGCGEKEALQIVEQEKIEKIWIAAVNSPQSCTMGGTFEAVQKLAQKCKELNLFHRVLNVTNAYHTPLLSSLREQALALFNNTLQGVKNKPSIPTISTVTGEFWEKEFDSEYFWVNIENAVLFEKSIQTAMQKYGNQCVFLEMAPHPVLSMSMKQCGVENSLYSLHRNEDEDFSILRACTQLVAHGYGLNWDAITGKPSVGKVNYLPPYPFQRKVCFFESEFNREERLVPDYKALLGPSLVSAKKTYQNYVNTAGYPWLADHVVQEATVFPAAGYIEMALEAFGSSVENVVINNAMIVPTDSSFNIVQSVIQSLPNTNGLQKIDIFSKLENSTSWNHHASAQASSSNSSEVPEQVDLHAMINQEALKQKYAEQQAQGKAYKRFEVMNLFYGPNFQCISALYQGDEEAYAILTTDHLENKEDFVVHPAVLDCCFQSFLGALKSSSHTYLPTSCKRVEVRGTIPSQLHVFCSIDNIMENTICGSITAYDNNGKLILVVSEFTCTLVPNSESDNSRMYSTVFQDKSLPNIDLVSTPRDSLNTLIQQWSALVPSIPKIDQALSYYLQKALKQLPADWNSDALSIDRKRYFAWAKEFVSTHPTSMNSDEEVTKFLEDSQQLPEFTLEAQMIKRVGTHLSELWSGENNAISRIMFSDDLMNRLYNKTVTFRSGIEKFLSLFDSISLEKDRVIRILEVGAGTGSLTVELLPILKSKFEGRVEYIFTDISASFMTQNKRFKEYNFVTYKTCNIEKDLESQGFEPHSIDFVIGFDVIHTATDLNIALQNIRRILVPNGSFMVIEPTYNPGYMNFIFGIFKDWWNFSDFRTEHCCLNKDQWTGVLSKNDFSRAQVHTEQGHVHSIIFASNNFQYHSLETTTTTTTRPVEDSVVVFTSKNVKDLLALTQKMISEEDHRPLIVVTENTQMECKNPIEASLIGFARVFANEYPNQIVRIMDLDSSMKQEEKQVWIQRVCQHLSDFEIEFAIRQDNHVYVPKLLQVNTHSQGDANKKSLQKPYRLENDVPGLLDSLVYREFHVPNPLPDHHVLVRVKATPLNFKDVMLALNMLNIADPYLGLEFAGVVEQVGPLVTKFKVGDAVYGFAKHCLASHVIANEYMICKKASNLSFVEAASVPAVFVTSYFSLIYKAQMKEDDRVLIHSAAGGVGQSAIQLVNWKKGIVYATVGSETKKKFLKEKYGVTHFADSHHAEWDQQVRNQTPNQRGVDVVLNSLSGVNIEKGLKLLAPYGNFVEIGKRDILDNTHIGLLPFLHNLSYFSVHLDLLTDERPKLVGQLLEEVNTLLEQNIIHAIVDKVYDAKNVKEAIRFMQTGKHIGKIVVNYETEEVLPEVVLGPSKLFHSQKTYILSGGLGAVGFEIAKWMIKEEDAKYLVLLSRNPKLSKYQKREIANLEKEKGCKVTIIKADVTNKEDVEAVLKQVKDAHLPPIGGIFNLAMVLEDEKITKLTVESLERVMKPKIEGSLNLIAPFQPQDLDFVFFFSSIATTIGNLSQANYSAANAAVDALAYNLSNQGFKARVLNLGAVDDVGVIATDFQLRKNMATRGLGTTISVRQVCQTVRQILQGNYVQQISRFQFQSMHEQCPSVKSKISHLVEYVQAEDDDSNSADSVSSAMVLLTKQIAKLLLIEPSAIDPAEKLTSYGVDSLLAVEIGSLIKKTLKLKISQMEILGGITLNQLRTKMEQH